MACDPSKKCPICDQRGLPLLPVRYNVARADEVNPAVAAPELPEGFSAANIPLPAERAHYTLRMLRAGYLYTYHAKRDEWTGYVVSDDAHLVAYDMHGTPPMLANAEPCARMQREQTGRFIIVPDGQFPEQLGEFWMAYSAVAWTAETWEKHKSPTFRARHMRQVDLAAWANNSNQAQNHLCGLYQGLEQVADLHLAAGYSVPGIGAEPPTMATVSVYPGNLPFEHSLTSLVGFNKAQVDALRVAVRSAAGQTTPEDMVRVAPAMVALDDPIGMAADLNQLVLGQLLTWAEEPDRKEKHTTAVSITALREAVANGAVLSEEFARKERAMIQSSVIQNLFGRAHTQQFIRPVEEWDDAWFQVEDEAEVLRLGSEAWEKYEKQLKRASGGKCEYEEYLATTYPQELEAIGKQAIRPLDVAYLAWLEAPEFKQHMICNFDPKNAGDGIQYQEAVAAILGESLARTQVFDYVTKCLMNDDPADEKSIIMRAFAWNLDEAVAQWKNAAAKMDGSAPDWLGVSSTLYTAFSKALENGASGKLVGAFAGLAKFMEKMAAPVAGLVGKAVDLLGAKSTMLLSHKMQMSLLSALVKADSPNLQVVDLRAYATPKAATRAVAAAVAAKAGIWPPEGARSPAREALRRGGTPAKGFAFNMVVLADTEELGLVKALNINDPMFRGVRNEAITRALSSHEFDRLMYQSVGKLNHLEFGTGVVGMIFAAASLKSLISEYEKAAPTAQKLKLWNLRAGLAALLGGAAETIGALGRKLPWLSQNLAKAMGPLMFRAETRAAVLAAGGRWLTGAAGLVSGSVLISEGWNDASLNLTYGGLMVAAGGASIAAAGMLMFCVAVPAAIFILLVVAIVTIVLSWFKPDEIERWLNKTLHFGRNSSGVFPDLETQINDMGSIGKAS